MRTLCVTLLGLFLVSGCGSDEPIETSRDSQPAATEEVAEPRVLTSDELTAALLTVDDLPTGFSVDETALEDLESTDEIVRASGDSCTDLWEATETPFGDEEYVEASAAFAGGELGPFLTQDLIAVDESAVASEFATLQLAIEDCTSLVSRDADGFETSVEFAPITAPDLGDKNFAFEMRITYAYGDVEVDALATLVMTSVGGNLMILSSIVVEMGEPFEAAEFEALAQVAVARLQDAAAAR